MDCKIEFTKYQGCGNDFIVKDERRGRRTPDPDRSRLAKVLCDRHFSVGADGVIFLESAKGLDGSMRLFEPAGNEADMCGNGLRCVAAYLMERLGRTEVLVLTRDGVKRIVREGRLYRVDMGQVRTRREDLREYIRDADEEGSDLADVRIRVGRRVIRGRIVNTGEPHIVVRVKDIGSEDVRHIGEVLNADRARFPKGMNINFVEVAGHGSVRVRTYERGVYDETLACGTGATACAAVSLLEGWVKSGRIRVELRGGTLAIDVSEDGRVYMTGPAEPVFKGMVSVGV